MAKIIDIEEYAASGKKIPVDIGTQYRVRVNSKTIVLQKRMVTGKELLISAGHDPENSNLFAHYKGVNQPSPIGIGDNIDLAKGVQRFTQSPTQALFGMQG